MSRNVLIADSLRNYRPPGGSQTLLPNVRGEENFNEVCVTRLSSALPLVAGNRKMSKRFRR